MGTTTHLSEFQPFEPHPRITHSSHYSEENSHPYILNPLIGDNMQHLVPPIKIIFFNDYYHLMHIMKISSNNSNPAPSKPNHANTKFTSQTLILKTEPNPHPYLT